MSNRRQHRLIPFPATLPHMPQRPIASPSKATASIVATCPLIDVTDIVERVHQLMLNNPIAPNRNAA